jgi:hypothetical protein
MTHHRIAAGIVVSPFKIGRRERGDTAVAPAGWAGFPLARIKIFVQRAISRLNKI